MRGSGSTPSERVGPLLSWAGRLRFPRLFALAALIFVADLLVPDLIPFVDEILFGLVTVLLGAWRGRRAAARQRPPGSA